MTLAWFMETDKQFLMLEKVWFEKKKMMVLLLTYLSIVV